MGNARRAGIRSKARCSLTDNLMSMQNALPTNSGKCSNTDVKWAVIERV